MNDQLTEQIIGAAFRVHNALGFGFLESVYEKALSFELTKLGVAHQRQSPINVYYEDQLVGEFVCDLFVAARMIAMVLPLDMGFFYIENFELPSSQSTERPGSSGPSD